MAIFDPSIRITRLPWSANAIMHAADQVLGDATAPLDLSKVCILLSEVRAQKDCRFSVNQLAHQRGINALIGPEIASLQQLAGDMPLDDWQIIDNSALQLILFDALKEHHFLYGKSSPLALAHDLLRLFEQITHYDVQTPDNAGDLFDRIQDAYGKQDNIDAIESRFADRESRLIHQIWQALKIQLKQEGKMDQASAYAAQLEQLASLRQSWRFIYVGLQPLQAIDIHCLNLLAKNNRVDIITYNNDKNDFYIEDNSQPLSIESKQTTQSHETFYDMLLQPNADGLASRKQHCLQAFPQSPIANKLYIHASHHLEQEAETIELQIRDWLQQSKNRIGFVCNDRKLARRVRARLERYHIHFNDKSGWSLSTSRSASILEFWLQCLETDFNYQVFLDLLKSPLVVKHDEQKTWLTAVYRFEKNVVYIEQINSGIQRYVKACQHIVRKLPEDAHAPYLYMIELLARFDQAAAILRPYLDGTHAPRIILDALCQSLKKLGCFDQIVQDHVGNIVVELLQQLQISAANSGVLCQWKEFRAWLGLNLEQARFNPPQQAASIQLLTLEQSDLQEFDAIIIGGAEKEFMPGHQSASTFFNDSARRHLGLPDAQTQYARSFHYFRRLLGFSERQDQAHPILISFRLFDKQEPVEICPWVEALQTSHRLIYGSNLNADYIDDWIAQIEQQQQANRAVTEQRASAKVTQALMPKRVSASAYQQLMNCPYQYYAARALRLQASETIKSYMEKSDYGELVHRCLYAFHFGIKSIAKAFTQSINADNQQQAISYLQDISDRVFAEAIEENTIHRAWRSKWERSIPAYIRWFQQQQAQWPPRLGEVALNLSLELSQSKRIELVATVDRIDADAQQSRILDYKTGSIPSSEEVAAGEAVQLPFYALLFAHSDQLKANALEQLGYLKLDDGDVRLLSCLEREEIDWQCEQHRQRLHLIFNDIANGEALPAWGDESACQYCDYAGLCRREYTL